MAGSSKLPAAFALFPKDISRPPREWAEQFFNVQPWTEMPRGGYFAAMEEPELLVADIRAWFRGFATGAVSTHCDSSDELHCDWVLVHVHMGAKVLTNGSEVPVCCSRNVQANEILPVRAKLPQHRSIA